MEVDFLMRDVVCIDQIEQAEAVLKPQRDLRQTRDRLSLGYLLDLMEDVQADPTNPPYPGWAGWLAGLAELRRYHELPRWRPIWRQIEATGVPAGMMAIDE